MAIIGPEQLPVVLKVDSNQLKLHALSQLGHPNVLVELGETQMEQILRSTGDWIIQYAPLEELYAFFMTKPLQAEYPLPEDAYWIREVAWDPATTRIDDIFGAESFLFSHSDSSILLTEKGPHSCKEVAEEGYKLITPFGKRKCKIRWNQKRQPALIISTENDKIICTPNHPLMCDGDYIVASECRVGMSLSSYSDKDISITDIEPTELEGTWSIQTSVGCYYISINGEEFYLSH